MLTVEQITLREIHLALKEPFRISSGVVAERRILLVELRDTDGVAAWSECVTDAKPNYSPETIDTAWFAIREWLAPRLLGRSIEGPQAVAALLADGVVGHPMAKAALEMACWALDANHRGWSLAARLAAGQMTGSHPVAPPPPRKQVATGISLGIQESTAALVERAAAAHAAGYQKIKLKIMPGADIEPVRAVRDALGPTAHLAVDANAAYTIADADRLAMLDTCALLMLEQPLSQHDLIRHAALQRRLSTPICLDESITDVDRAEDMIQLGSGRIVNIKPGRVGGFGASLAIHDLCAAHGIPVWCGGMLESGVGRAYNVALASLPNFVLPGDLSPSARYWERDIVVPEWTMDRKGIVQVPVDSPGLGVAVDVNRIDDLSVKCAILGCDTQVRRGTLGG